MGERPFVHSGRSRRRGGRPPAQNRPAENASAAAAGAVAPTGRGVVPTVVRRATATAAGDEATRCAACGRPGTVPWATIQGWRYAACAACDLVRLDPMPPAAVAASLYDESYFTASAHRGYADYIADERLHRLNARRHLRRLTRVGGSSPGRLVEIGAAAGFLLDEARRRGWQVCGVEVAPSMRRAARELHGIELVGAIDDLGMDVGELDVAVANQALEHVVDPLGTLADLRSRMRPGGLLSLETWDRGAAIARLFGHRWQQVNPPSVLWLWDAAQLRRVVERAGFEVLVCRPAVKLVSAATVAGQLGRRGPFGCVPIPYGLGDLTVLVARADGRSSSGP